VMSTSARNCGSKGFAPASNAYADYLQLPALLSLQRPAGSPPVPDELLFIIVHQAHELWFKQMLQDLGQLVVHLEEDAWEQAATRLDRLVRIVQLLVDHLDVLSTMPASEFQAFRAALGSASGMQSEQYRELERLVGRESNERESKEAVAPGVAPGSLRSSVRATFLHALRRAQPQSGVLAGAGETCLDGPLLAELWQSTDLSAERAVAERLLAFDQQMIAWRGGHVALARQMIGEANGTGGSAGVRYLEHAAARRFFPELHEAGLHAATASASA
jgi:tryptophan 2,3-dioxygenase